MAFEGRMWTGWAPHAPGTCVEGDGRAIARANRDIAPGDALTINYGTKELPQWPLQQRRRFLLELVVLAYSMSSSLIGARCSSGTEPSPVCMSTNCVGVFLQQQQFMKAAGALRSAPNSSRSATMSGSPVVTATCRGVLL